MDVNGVNNMEDEPENDTISSAEDVGIGNFGEVNGNFEEVDGDGTNTELKPVEYSGVSPDKPILKCPETGQFLPGTGTSGKGGRPKGSKDRVSSQLKAIGEDLMRRRGRELLEEVANRSPENALALVLKIIPPSELSALFEQDRAEAESSETNVNIRLVAAPSPRLSDTRSEADIQAQQRGLASPVERIEKPSEDAVVATQMDADEEAARAERERQERQRDAIKAHGGLTGRATRRSAPDVIEYRDDGEVI